MPTPTFHRAPREDATPTIDRVTVEWLARQFPERSPRPFNRQFPSIEQVWFEAGQRHVVRLLENVLEQQENPGHVPQNAKAEASGNSS